MPTVIRTNGTNPGSLSKMILPTARTKPTTVSSAERRRCTVRLLMRRRNELEPWDSTPWRKTFPQAREALPFLQRPGRGRRLQVLEPHDPHALEARKLRRAGASGPQLDVRRQRGA